MRHLTIEQCRKALPAHCDFSDAEVEALSNYFYTAALSGIELFERLPLLLDEPAEEFGPPELDD